MKQSAGTLLYRHGEEGLEVLLVHGSGWYNRQKPWGIPKGELDDGEDLEAAARRETWEETGVAVKGPLIALGHITYSKSKKRVFAFAGEAPSGCSPHCASWEVDQACFLSLPRAREVMHPEQMAFLDRLEKHLANEGAKS